MRVIKVRNFPDLLQYILMSSKLKSTQSLWVPETKNYIEGIYFQSKEKG